jgi:hypothetical protein
MAKLTAKERKKIPSTDFALPEDRAFPIEDETHARDALSRAARKPPAVEKKVRAAVKKKYPDVGKEQ